MLGAIPKFNFVPEKQLIKNIEGSYEVSLYVKDIKRSGKDELEKFVLLCFSKTTTNIYDLDGKFIRFYADKEKKTIGWSILEKAEGLAQLEGVRQIKASSQGIRLGIAKLIKVIGVKVESRKKIEVKKYESSLQSHPIYYITL